MIFNQAKHTRTKLLSESQSRAVACADGEPRIALGLVLIALATCFASAGAWAAPTYTTPKAATAPAAPGTTTDGGGSAAVGDPGQSGGDPGQGGGLGGGVNRTPTAVTPANPVTGTAPVKPASSVGGATTGTFNVQSPYAVVNVKPTNQAPFTDKTQYSECGQDCLYQKGNENISLQALYVVNKISNIQNILNDTTFRPEDYNSIMGEMGPYCPDVVSANRPFDPDASFDDANKCYQRYLQVQIPLLKKMKAAIVANEDASGQLQTNQRLVVQSGITGGEIKKASVFAAAQDSKPKKPQTPEFETEDELLATPQGQKKLQVLASESYAKWATEQMQAVAPKKEDYAATMDVHRDPNDPSSEIITRIMRNPDGSPILDAKGKKAFEEAKIEYAAQLTGTQTDKSFEQLAKDPAYSKIAVGSLDPVLRQKNLPKGQVVDYRLDEVSYEQARNQAVQATTDLLRKEGVLAGGSSNRGLKKAAIAAAAAAKKAIAKIDPGSEYGARNVLKDPTGPGIDKKGNAVQPRTQANSTTAGDYTVSFKPSEIDSTTQDLQKLLVQTRQDSEKASAAAAGLPPPPAAPAPKGPPAVQTPPVVNGLSGSQPLTADEQEKAAAYRSFAGTQSSGQVGDTTAGAQSTQDSGDSQQ